MARGDARPKATSRKRQAPPSSDNEKDNEDGNKDNSDDGEEDGFARLGPKRKARRLPGDDDDDDSDQQPEDRSSKKQKKKRKSVFEPSSSDDDDDEEDLVEKIKPVPRPPPTSTAHVRAANGTQALVTSKDVKKAEAILVSSESETDKEAKSARRTVSKLMSAGSSSSSSKPPPVKAKPAKAAKPAPKTKKATATTSSSRGKSKKSAPPSDSSSSDEEEDAEDVLDSEDSPVAPARKSTTSKPKPKPTKSLAKSKTRNSSIETLAAATNNEPAKPKAKGISAYMVDPRLVSSQQASQEPHQPRAQQPTSTSGPPSPPSWPRQVSQDLWVDKYKPANVKDLEVHHKKVEEVSNWLKQHSLGPMRQRRPAVLLLTGPSGSGKTATVRAVCKEFGIEIAEWINPETDSAAGFDSKSDEPRGVEGFAAQFTDFLRQSSRFASSALGISMGPASSSSSSSSSSLRIESPSKLDTPPDLLRPRTTATPTSAPTPKQPSSKIILIEDIPNIAASKTLRERFHADLLAYSRNNAAKFPIVIIASDIGSGWEDSERDSVITPRTILPTQLRAAMNCVSEIKFNPVAHSYLVKLINKVALAERNSIGRPLKWEEAEALAHRSGGDLRCAINALQFMAVMDESITSRSVGAQKKKQEDRIKDAEKVVNQNLGNGRETTLPLYHALGKCLYNKRTLPGDDEESSERKPAPPKPREAILTFNPEDVIDAAHMPANVFVLHLQQNYPSFYASADELAEAAARISDADHDFLRHSFTHGELAGNYGAIIATRGLLWAHEAPIPPCPESLMGRNRQRTLHKPEYWQRAREAADNANTVLSIAHGATAVPTSADGTRGFYGVGQGVEALKLDLLPYSALLSRPVGTNRWAQNQNDVGSLLAAFTKFSVDTRVRLQAVDDRELGIDAVREQQEQAAGVEATATQVEPTPDAAVPSASDPMEPPPGTQQPSASQIDLVEAANTREAYLPAWDPDDDIVDTDSGSEDGGAPQNNNNNNNNNNLYNNTTNAPGTSSVGGTIATGGGGQGGGDSFDEFDDGMDGALADMDLDLIAASANY